MTDKVEFETYSDEWWLQTAYATALGSQDPSTQNGAILLCVNHGVSSDRHDRRYTTLYAYNRFPDEVKVKPDRLKRPLKYWATEHAERNAIFAAAYDGYSTRDSIMYCCWAACSDCARAIIQAGVKKLVYHDPEIHYSRPDWQPDIDFATQMMKEAGVRLVPIKTFLGVPIRFNYENVIV